MTRIAHIITGLGMGGAEAAMSRLAINDRSREHHIVSMTDSGHFGDVLASAGVAVHTLNMSRGPVTRLGVGRLGRLLRSIAPHVVQTWMYHADLMGGLGARWAGISGVVWGIRSAWPETGVSSFRTRAVANVCALASHFLPARIVSCSEVVRRSHVDRGYDSSRMVVIPNGFDLRQLRRDMSERTRLRDAWKVPVGSMALGMMARWDPYKDHATLFNALSQLGYNDQPWLAIMGGPGMVAENNDLMALLRRYGLESLVRLTGETTDVAAFMSALDLHVLSSRGEAFPNVVGEAMACGVPCVVTDVGDAALIVGDTGWIVPPRDPVGLASGLRRAIEAMQPPGEQERLGAAARARITARFPLSGMLEAYGGLWDEVRQGLAPSRAADRPRGP